MNEQAQKMLMRLIAFGLDAAVEQGVSITPDQYRKALLRAMEWGSSEGHKTPPEYEEALETAIDVWIVKWRARQAQRMEEK